jgi:CBS domain-containing protein
MAWRNREKTVRVGDYCKQPVVSVVPKDSPHHAARQMRKHHVGDVVVVQQRGGVLLPIGIVTDRDLAIEILASDTDPELVCVGDLVSDTLVTAHVDEELIAVLDKMSMAGVRRVPVVRRSGELVGILSLDDVLQLLAFQLTEVARVIARQQAREARLRP